MIRQAFTIPFLLYLQIIARWHKAYIAALWTQRLRRCAYRCTHSCTAQYWFFSTDQEASLQGAFNFPFLCPSSLQWYLLALESESNTRQNARAGQAGRWGRTVVLVWARWRVLKAQSVCYTLQVKSEIVQKSCEQGRRLLFAFWSSVLGLWRKEVWRWCFSCIWVAERWLK